MPWEKSYEQIYTTKQGLSKAQIWRHWQDPNTWSTWDHDLDYCKLTEPFITGNSFALKPRGGPELKLSLVEVIPEERFITKCHFPGAEMEHRHELEETKDGNLRVKLTVTVTGWLSFFWGWCVGNQVIGGAPKQMSTLVDMIHADSKEESGHSKT